VISLTGYDGSPDPRGYGASAERRRSRYLQRMDDSFSLGHQPKKRRGRLASSPRHAAPRTSAAPPGHVRPTHARKSSFEHTRVVLGILALAVVGVLVWGLMHYMSTSGQQAAAEEGAAIDHAQDVQAQLTGSSAIQSVEAVYATAGSFQQVTPQALKAYEPTFTYTAEASTEPNTVSVDSTAQGVGLAVYSSSGTCLYAHVAAAGVTYGTGPTCTGEAALQASKPAWPTAS
jgi:hypothetical protein